MDFVPNDGTIEQLKNSGSLRLVRKKDVVDKLMDYNKSTELIRLHQSAMNSYLFQQTSKSDLFDIPHFANKDKRANVSLLSSDKKLISGAYLYISDWKIQLRILNNYIAIAKTKGKDLLKSIKKKYHLENE